jgi:chemotaxis protein methyltransferase CheR
MSRQRLHAASPFDIPHLFSRLQRHHEDKHIIMPIAAADFDFVRNLVQGQAGIVLEPGKEYLVESRLQPLARNEGLETIEKLVTKLRGPGNGGLTSKIIDAMTTNETTFFRDVEPFEALRKHVLPELIEAKKQTKRLSIWYAASSTGQEPYSVSMLIQEHFPALLSWDLRQLATDISPTVLARARAGKFSQLEVNRGLPINYLLKYFTKHGNDWQLNDSVRSMVRFEELNLVRPWPPMDTVDIVMIRNVMIYFDVEIKKQILSKIRTLLNPDGYLFLGGAETTMNLDDAFARQQFDRAGCYRMRSAAAV